ncbi:DMAC1 protein, partial [Syrrhaptes paradoxus]|nr:DMAC1 protein [Syrrhaptes paradoxus]
ISTKMAAEAETEAAPVPVPVPTKPLFGGCWSCRALSAAGLLTAAVWIYRGPRQSMKRGIPPSMAAIAQITFAIGEALRGQNGG